MKITSISYSRLVSVERYGNIKVDATASVDPTDDPDDAFTELRQWVDLQVLTKKHKIEGAIPQEPDDDPPFKASAPLNPLLAVPDAQVQDLIDAFGPQRVPYRGKRAVIFHGTQQAEIVVSDGFDRPIEQRVVSGDLARAFLARVGPMLSGDIEVSGMATESDSAAPAYDSAAPAYDDDEGGEDGMETCPECHGYGHQLGNVLAPCVICEGEGRISEDLYDEWNVTQHALFLGPTA